MSINLSIKGVPESLAERLRQRAESNHRSLQGELMAIIEQAVAAGGAHSAHPPAAGTRTLSQGWKTIEDLVAERAARNTQPVKGGPLAVDIIRADRDSR
jgi:antitoxin FitA